MNDISTINITDVKQSVKSPRKPRKRDAHQGDEYDRGYQAGYHAGIRCVRKKYEDSSPCHWVGEADGYADGELVYDIWSCGACGYYFDEWDEEPTWDFCPRCGEPMTEQGVMLRLSQFKKEVE